MHRRKAVCIFVAVGLCLPAGVCRGQSAGDVSLDRQGGTVDLTTECRSQCWGTCWCHGTMSAMESNLLSTGNWLFEGSPWSAPGDVDLAEYHLDKFNGANRKGEPGDETDAGAYPGQEPPWPGTNTDVPLEDRTRYQGGGMPVQLYGVTRAVVARNQLHTGTSANGLAAFSGAYPKTPVCDRVIVEDNVIRPSTNRNHSGFWAHASATRFYFARNTIRSNRWIG